MNRDQYLLRGLVTAQRERKMALKTRDPGLIKSAETRLAVAWKNAIDHVDATTRSAVLGHVSGLPANAALRAEQPSAGDGWQPISTAPKDGTEITLGFMENGKITQTADMQWSHIQRNGLFPGVVGMWVCPGGNFTWNPEPAEFGPTHWKRKPSAGDGRQAPVHQPVVSDLLAEHEQWASWFGEALVLALQDDYSKVDELAKSMKFTFSTGAAVLRSDAIASASATGDGTRAAHLTAAEIACLMGELAPDHDGRDFEAECPSCAAYQKLLARSAQPTHWTPEMVARLEVMVEEIKFDDPHSPSLNQPASAGDSGQPLAPAVVEHWMSRVAGNMRLPRPPASPAPQPQPDGSQT